MMTHQKLIKVLRNFIPVGQGACYCEKLITKDDSKFNVIYDCGSLTNKKFVEDEIRGTFDKNEVIHALFISHFDDDHVNGIPFLLEYCKVERIFFPILTNENIIIMSMTEDESSFSNRFFNNPLSTISELSSDKKTVLYGISSVFDESESASTKEEQKKQEKKYDDSIKILESGEDVVQEIVRGFGDGFSIDWAYIPFNFRQNTRAEQLKKEIEKEFGAMSIDEIKNNISSDIKIRKRVKNTYEKISGSINTNSMTLFSGPLNNSWDQRFFYEKNYMCMCNRNFLYNKAGCLYMGDYDASGIQKFNTLKKAYKQKKCWNKIGCIQIPHHGSRHNFTEELLDDDVFYIISAGYNNKFRHPHNIVINNMLSRYIIPHIITEYKGSAVYVVVTADEGL